jgi:threonine dehydratase
MVQLADVALAHYRLSRYLSPTPLEQANLPAEAVWLKLENANPTHSFKLRGALNALLALGEKARNRGIIACSSGNHAQGLAWAAQLLNCSAQLIMPKHTPQRKVDGVRRYGGEVVLYGETYDEAEEEARRREQHEGRTFVSPYNDAAVIAGAGTIGLELLEALPTLDRVIVPVSGGGLISGIALTVKALRPQIEVIGVCAQSAPAMYNLFYDSAHPQVPETLAEALSGDIEAKSITTDLAQRFVDQIVLVSESEIAQAMRWAVFEQGWVVEGGGATGIAALHSGLVEDGGQTAIVVSGGNVDADTLRGVLNATP